MLNALIAVLTAPYVLLALGIILTAAYVVHRVENPRPRDTTTYWLGSQQITRHDYAALLAAGHPVREETPDA